jgi:hypothetical protein
MSGVNGMFTRDSLPDIHMRDSELPTPKAQRQRAEYMQDVGNSLFTQYRAELEEEIKKQYNFGLHGQGGPDVFPPSGFIIFSRLKLMCNSFIETHLNHSRDEVCRQWIRMTAEEQKPFNDSSKYLNDKWDGI